MLKDLKNLADKTAKEEAEKIAKEKETARIAAEAKVA